MHLIGTRRVYEGRVLNLRVDDVEFGAGKRGDIEIVEHNGGVAIIAQPFAHHVLMVRQYRPAAGRYLWEIPAGKLEKGEEPAAAAERELREETGYRAGELRRLWTFFTAPGFCTELMHLFVATQLVPGASSPDEHELLEIKPVSVDEAWALVQRDELPDAKTQIALAWLAASAR